MTDAALHYATQAVLARADAIARAVAEGSDPSAHVAGLAKMAALRDECVSRLSQPATLGASSPKETR